MIAFKSTGKIELVLEMYLKVSMSHINLISAIILPIRLFSKFIYEICMSFLLQSGKELINAFM